MTNWGWFIGVFFLGGALGVLTMALCRAAAQGEARADVMRLNSELEILEWWTPICEIDGIATGHY